MGGEAGDASGQRAGDLLHHDDGVQEISAAPAVFLGGAGQQDAGRAGPAPQISRHQTVLFPLVVVGRDLVRDETCHGVAEQFMVRGEKSALLVHAVS
ncbi:hypothetical protein D3C73_1476380 [compost metagenome]